MEDIDRPAHVQPLSQPAWARRPRVKMQPRRVVLRFERADRISGHQRRRRHVRQEPAVWPSELEGAAGVAIDLVTLLVDRAVVAATEQREIRERRRAAFGPVAHVMTFAQQQSAPRETAAAISMVQRTPYRRRNRPRSRADFHDTSILVVPHHDAAGITCQAPTRFRGNVSAVLEHGLTGLIRVGEHGRIDVHDHLVPLPRRAGIELVVQRCLGE
jgi:hypothetical protein